MLANGIVPVDCSGKYANANIAHRPKKINPTQYWIKSRNAKLKVDKLHTLCSMIYIYIYAHLCTAHTYIIINEQYISFGSLHINARAVRCIRIASSARFWFSLCTHSLYPHMEFEIFIYNFHTDRGQNTNRNQNTPYPAFICALLPVDS